MFAKIWHNIQTLLRRYFVAGILTFAPIGITIWAIASIVQYLDKLILPHVLAAIFPDVAEAPSIPLVGAVFTLVVILLFGVIARHLFGWELVRLTERALSRVPVARNIYNAVKQLAEAIFRTETQSAFRRVVLVEYPRRDVWAIAFTTGAASPYLQSRFDEQMVNVFVPTTPNPTSGFFLLVPDRDLREVNLDVEQAFKLIMSAGLVTPDEALVAAPVAPDAVGVSTPEPQRS